nr:nuclear transport factor 2 family protein [uncultured Hyphomonas sp.]
MTIEITAQFAEQFAQQVATAWERQDVSAAVALFEASELYLEDPFATNAASRDDGIRSLWEATLLQSNIKIETTLMALDQNAAVVRYDAEYTTETGNHQTSGIWCLEFRAKKCVKFRQWFNQKLTLEQT